MGRFLLHAPNIHVGGGAVLLRALLSSANFPGFWANLDARISDSLNFQEGEQYHFVRPTLQGRLHAELRLARYAQEGDVVLCFHGLPPIFPVKGRVVVFKQNRIHLGLDPLSMFSLRTRIRLMVEQLLCNIFRSRVSEYIVQTPSMKIAVEAWHGGMPNVRIMPFLSDLPVKNNESRHIESDFIYVADGEAHKNHKTLIEAWVLLAHEGIFPSLTLTLPSRAQHLWKEIEGRIGEHGLRITNLGSIPHSSVLVLYNTAGALIFPSTTESFGLPLIEAAAMQLPIVASELDYVRDVCEPQETFNPNSARSIAAAVKRFMHIPAASLLIRSPEDFISELLGNLIM